jgi:hypothetical protein
MTTSLVEKVVALTDALRAAGIPHAFGGALALAYCTAEPRATRDIDLNLFLDAESASEALDAMPAGVVHGSRDITAIEDDGQVRLWWDITPVDLFFSYHPIHGYAADHARQVPFADAAIPVLDGTSLVVFKAAFNRPKDWVDIASVAEARAADFDVALDWLQSFLDDDDPRVQRLTAIASGPRTV